MQKTYNKSKGNNKKQKRDTKKTALSYNMTDKQCNFRTMPTEFNVRQKWSSNAQYAGANNGIFGINLFLNHLPYYTKELFAIYKYCRVVKTHVKITVTNLDTEPLQLVMAPCPWSTYLAGSASIDALREEPSSVITIIGSTFGKSNASISRCYNGQQFFGNVVASDKDYWMNSSTAMATTPPDPDDKVIVWRLNDMTGATAGKAYICFEVTYDVRWFNLETALISFEDTPDYDLPNQSTYKIPPSASLSQWKKK